MSWCFDDCLWIKKHCNKGNVFRCILWGISRDEAVNRLNNSVLQDKDVLQINFSANKTPGAFEGA